MWVLWAAVLSRTDALSLTVVFLSLIFVPSFLLIGATERANPDKPTLIDWILSAFAAACAAYFIYFIPETASRISLLSDLRIDQFVMAGILILLTLEITRRTVGVFLMMIVLALGMSKPLSIMEVDTNTSKSPSMKRNIMSSNCLPSI